MLHHTVYKKNLKQQMENLKEKTPR